MEKYSKVYPSKWQSQYSKEFKQSVCKEYLLGNDSRTGIEKKYHLGHGRILNWLKEDGYVELPCSLNKSVYIVGLDNYNPMSADNPQLPSQTTTSLNEVCEDQSEILRLKKELLEAKIKAEGFERMIEIAEEQFKILIKKK